MKNSTARKITLLLLYLISFKSVLSKDPVSDFDLAWTIHALGDNDRNGILNESEISRFYQKEIQFPQELAHFVAKRMIERGDMDNDRGLSLDETIRAMESVRHKRAI